MAMSTMMFSPLIVLLALSGGIGLPMGVPPAPEDPMMSQAAPEQCLFYTTWAGMAEPDATSENQTEQLLAEPEVQHLIAEVERQITAALVKAAEGEGPEAVPMVKDAIGWFKTLITQPTMMYVGEVKIPGPDEQINGEAPDIRAGAMVRIGGDIANLRAKLEGYQLMVLRDKVATVQINGQPWYRLTFDPQAPKITWGTWGEYLIVTVGEGETEALLARTQTPAPAWLTELRQQLPVERISTVSYVDVKSIMDLALRAYMGAYEAARDFDGPPVALPPMARNPVAAFLNASGLNKVTSLASVTGLDGEGFVSRTQVGIEGVPRGLLSFVDAKPLAAGDLATIPSDATIAMALRINAEAVFDTITSMVGQIEPRARGEMAQGIAMMEASLGFNLRNDVLKALGDSICIYNSPGEGGLVVTGVTAVIDVKDRESLAMVNERLIALFKAQMQREEEYRREESGRYYRPSPRIEQFEFAGQTVYFFNARESDVPVAPAWCLTEDKLIAALFPQNIKSYLSRGAEFEPITTLPKVAGLFEGDAGPLAMMYVDTKSVFELVYPLVPMLLQVGLGELSRGGIDVNIGPLPSAPAIGRHLSGSVSAVRRNEAGVELIARQTLPGGSIGASVPVMAAVAIPAVVSSRGAAQRAMSMNNMRQLGIAMQQHLVRYDSFPPAYTTDADGKPLLSWRVQILPYIEGQGLYERFRLDEPWDSEHNKQLIPLMPMVFRSPVSKAGPGMTNYLTVRGKDTVFPGAEKIKMAQITDGMSNTIMIVEVDDSKAVPWTKPDDFEYDEDDPAAGLGGLWGNGFNVVLCDGSSRFIGRWVDPDMLGLLFTRNDGERVDVWDLEGPYRDGPVLGFGRDKEAVPSVRRPMEPRDMPLRPIEEIEEPIFESPEELDPEEMELKELEERERREESILRPGKEVPYRNPVLKTFGLPREPESKTEKAPR